MPIDRIGPVGCQAAYGPAAIERPEGGPVPPKEAPLPLAPANFNLMEACQLKQAISLAPRQEARLDVFVKALARLLQGALFNF